MWHLSLDVPLERVQLLVPVRLQLIEPRLERDRSVRAASRNTRTRASVGDPFVDHDPRLEQDAQVAAHRGRRRARRGRELTRPVRALAEELHDVPAGRVGERPEDAVDRTV